MLDFSKLIDMYGDCKTDCYRSASFKKRISLLTKCLIEAIEYYSDEDGDFPTAFIIEMAMHYACNEGVFKVGSKAWYKYWIPDFEGYYSATKLC